MPDDPVSKGTQTSKINNRKIRLIDFVDSAGQVADSEFENCDILGPSILALFDTRMEECVFLTYKKPDDMLIPVEANRHVVGVIGVFRCVFRKCSFRNIGIIGTNAQLEILRNSPFKETAN